MSLYSKTLGVLLEDISYQLRQRDDAECEEGSDWRKKDEGLKASLLAISSLVGAKLMDKALSISCTKDAVIEIRAECGRSMFRVKGDTGEYKVLLVGFCDCFAFTKERSGAVLPICKHILAAHLAQAQGTAEIVRVSDTDWAKLGWGVNFA